MVIKKPKLNFFKLKKKLFLANFSQSNISEIVAESKSTIEESVKNSTMLKQQKHTNKPQDDCTTPIKNNGQC